MILLAFQFATLVPAYAAYAEPSPEAIVIDDGPWASGWGDVSQELAWYGESGSDGTVSLKVHVRSGTKRRLTLQVGRERLSAEGDGRTFDFGTFDVKRGPVRVALSTGRAPGPDVIAMEAKGDVRWAKSRRRNAASVHLRWPTPEGADVRWFYNEAAMLTDPVWSYTMACGFARGYFGMQVNSPTERRIIFSVWDAGSEAVSRDKVADENRVKLVAKGDGVVADSFGNEGTGGHSHLVWPWKTGKAVRFLVGCRPEGDRTLYAGYFKAPGDKAWRLVAAFRAPVDGKPLRSLYSFSENFGGANGQLWRESAFGNGWIGLADGSWRPLTEARFTTDGHGRTERWDTDAFVEKGRFHLRHGGLRSGTAKYGDSLVSGAETTPKMELPELPK